MPKIKNIKTDSKWHLDKRVPIALIFAIGVQTFGIAWWGATLTNRVSTLEEKAALSGPQGERLARVEENIRAIKDNLSDIKTLLRSK